MTTRDRAGEELRRLADLRSEGYLSDEDFFARRDAVIGLDAAGQLAPDDLVGKELTMLAALTEQGTIRREEFEARKAELLVPLEAAARRGARPARPGRPRRGSSRRLGRFAMAALLLLPLLVASGVVAALVSSAGGGSALPNLAPDEVDTTLEQFLTPAHASTAYRRAVGTRQVSLLAACVPTGQAASGSGAPTGTESQSYRCAYAYAPRSARVAGESAERLGMLGFGNCFAVALDGAVSRSGHC